MLSWGRDMGSVNMDVEKVKPLLRAVVQSNKGGVAAHRFNGEFRGIMGEDVPYRKLGFPSLNAFIETIPDTIRIGRDPDGELTYFAVADASTAHIQRMVAAQKSNKNKIRTKPSKGYLRKPAYKASWSTRSGPGMHPPQRPLTMHNFTGARPMQQRPMQQRPMQQRPMQQRPMQHHMQCHPMHITHNFVARPSHTLQMMRSNAIRPHPSANMPSPFVHTNLAGPRTSQNMQLLPMRSHLAGPRTLQNTHNFVMPRNSFVVSRPSQSNNVARPSQSNNMARPSQPSAMVRPAQTFQPSRQTSNDTAPYPVQKQTSNDTPSYSTQRQTSNNTVQYPVQKQMTNDTVSHSTQRQTSDDAVSCPTQKTQQDLMRSYSAPIPQQESTANHDSSQRLSVAGPETSRRILLSHKVNDQNTPPKLAKRLVSSTDLSRHRVQFDRMKLSPRGSGICVKVSDTKSKPMGLQITVKGQEPVPTAVVKYGKTYKIPPRFQRMEKQRNLENSDVELIFNDDPVVNGVTTLSSSSHLRADRAPLSIKQKLGSSSPPVAAVKPSINYTKFKDMLANYLREHGNSAAKYETACVGTSKAPNRFVSSIEIDGVIFGSLHVFSSADEAEDKAAQNACQELAICGKDDGDATKKNGMTPNIETKPVTPESNVDEKVKERVRQIALKHMSGLWSAQLPEEYRTTYWEEPPKDLLDLIENWTDIVKLELMAVSSRKIMYPVMEEKPIRLVQHSKVTHCYLSAGFCLRASVCGLLSAGFCLRASVCPTSAVTVELRAHCMEHYEVPLASIPKPGATVTVLISHLVDCSHFFVQCADSTINEIMEELAEIYEVRGSPKTLLNPKPGLFCVAKYEDDNWYRARILDVHTTADNTVECEVMYIDFGNCDIVPASKVLHILESSCKEPAQAICCSLHGIFPVEGDMWSEDASNFFFNLSMEKELKMDVIESDDTACSVVLRNMTDGSTDISINRQMVLDGVVSSMEPPPLELPENNDWPVLVMSVKMTTEVTMRLVGPDHSDKLEDLEENLSSLAASELPRQEPHVDGVYAACTTDGDDVSWGRVRVISVNGKECEVTFLDHGDTDVITRDALRPLSRQMNQLPYQALTCKLTGLEAYEKDQKVIDRLVEIALGKTCIAAVDDRLDKVSLTLWDTSSDEDVNINETAAKVLRTEDLAPKLPVRGGTIEVYVSCVSQQGDIYIQCQGPGLQQLEQVADHIEDQYGKAGIASAFVSSPQVNQLCIAKNSDSGNWYRAEVTKVLPGRMVEVRFVDHGIVDIIHYRYLRDLPEGSDLRDLPYQAVKCQLFGLPPEGSEWTSAVLDRLTELMPPDELRVLEVVMGAMEGEEGRELAQVEVYEIAKDGELIAVSETVTQEEDLWAEEDVFEDAPSEPYNSPRGDGELNDSDPRLQLDSPTPLIGPMGGISIAT
ncbi:hypothetical protein NP493_680g00019 [Ridgeia piscesae]|uniref:Uncharacterized protein n=1 Tax=Ridgeia piscesae TaxID=27915 RepID=A0AAD9NPR6_RIDPI|nr:hypothetical protein NP493_680g00019 [Ridgeia piscesae]